MDEPTDPLARQLAVSVLTTEHFNLQSARMGTITEANGRATLYLSTLSSAVIAIAFVGQANQLGDPFYLFALVVLPPVFLLGVQFPAAGADLNRGHRLCRGIVPDPPVLPWPGPGGGAVLPADRSPGDDEAGAHRGGVDRAPADAADRREHGGLHQRDRGRSGRGPGTALAAGGIGPGVRGGRHAGGPGVGGAVLAYQVRRFRRAATVVPELYEGQSPDMPGW